MAGDSEQRRNRVRSAIRELLEEEISKQDPVIFLDSVLHDLNLDDETLFAIGQSLTAKAFDTISRIRELLEEEISKQDPVIFLDSVLHDLNLDDKTLFAIGQSLTAKAFDTISRSRQIDDSPTLPDIKSDIAENDRMSPRHDRRERIPFSLDDDADESKARRQFLQRVRRLIPGIEERAGALGGYVCLADMSYRKSEQTEQWAIYNPAALGLAFTADVSSLYLLVQRERIRLERIEGHGFNAPDSVRIRVSNPGQPILVRIERGTVFERCSADHIQNLCVKDEVVTRLQSGMHEIEAFGMCMDQNVPSPDGESMLLTPWILRSRIEDQDDLWTFTGGRHGNGDGEPTSDDTEQAKCEYEIFGETRTAAKQKDAFVSIFDALSKHDDGFLERMAELYEESRVSPVVARDISDLRDAAQETAVEIGDGYWLRTKMDKKEKIQKLKEACKVADVEYGKAEGLRIIQFR